jgi:lipopolysaccharide/colanic/teichoic acid biosynthesis glycosyltransferase
MDATATKKNINKSAKSHLGSVQPNLRNKGLLVSMRKKIIILAIDWFFLLFSLLLALNFYNYTFAIFKENYFIPFIIFSIVWITMGLVFDKYGLRYAITLRHNVLQVFITNIACLGLLISLLYFTKVSFVDKKVVFLSVMLITAFEILFVVGWKRLFRGTDTFFYENHADLLENRHPKQKNIRVNPDEISFIPSVHITSLRESIISEVGEAVYNFIEAHCHDYPYQVLVVSTTTRFNILAQPQKKYQIIVNLRRINDIQYINKFFEAINSRIPNGGLFIGTAETYVQRKNRILAKYPRGINWVVYTVDFLVKRVMPKLWFTKKIYFFITRGQNRVISMAETFGRLYSCGFEVVEDCFIDGQLWFCVRKVKEPSFDPHPTYGPLIRLKRVGKGGKIIGVYKFRTMHAYAEYLQQYVYERNKLQAGGKFKDDFRITTIGKFMRKFWLDELPMFINVIKGDLKIVGVRPLSKHYLSLYTPELQQWRMKHKPGLIPPFYVDLPKSLEEIMESEIKYLKSYERSPFLTDFSYLMKALYNIFIKKARSN